jgi:hypothetical protein
LSAPIRNPLFELKSNILRPNFGHFSLVYIYSFVEYFLIFPVANESTKPGRLGVRAGMAMRSRAE